MEFRVYSKPLKNALFDKLLVERKKSKQDKYFTLQMKALRISPTEICIIKNHTNTMNEQSAQNLGAPAAFNFHFWQCR